MTESFPGAHKGQTWDELWLMAEIVDLELDEAYRVGGTPAV